ncbi:MAG: DUF177 domain-containing protein [Firmicutes bacterium]|nr:DUF177 domain-containing protein [Bacillota bacterium]
MISGRSLPAGLGKMLTMQIFTYIINFSASEVRIFSMKIDIAALKKEPGRPFTYDFTVDASQLELDADTELLSPLSVHLIAVYQDGKLVVNGKLSTKIKLVCSRCLKIFAHDFVEEFAEEIDISGETEQDLSWLAREIFYTALPLKPLCKATCRGLCETCGADLNEKQCDCAKDKTDPRWAVLGQLLK